MAWIVLSCIISGCLNANAQIPKLAQLDHTSWTAREGAPFNVSSIKPDTDGTLWLGSESGLYNFNGFTFLPFQAPPGDLQLPSAPISSMLMAKDGSLWVAPGTSGIARIRDHRIVRFYSDKDGLPNRYARQILELQDGTIIAIILNRLWQLRADRWEEVKASPSMSQEGIRNGFVDRSGTLWLATYQAVWKAPPGQLSLERTVETGGVACAFSQAMDGSVWLRVSTPGPTVTTFRRLAVGTESRLPAETIAMDGVAFLFDPKGFLWIGSQKGLLRVPMITHTQGQSTSRSIPDLSHAEQYNRLAGLTSDLPISLLEDKSGDIWVGTERGLDRFRTPHLMRFLSASESNRQVLAQCPGGELWIGAYESPMSLIRDGIPQQYGPIQEPEAAHCDQNGVLWLADLRGLWRYQDHRVSMVPGPATDRIDHAMGIVGNSDHLLFAIYPTLGVLRYVDGSWSKVQAADFPSGIPLSIYMDHLGHVWAGFPDDRIGMLDGSKGRTFLEAPPYPVGAVEVFLESRYGLLAGGTNGIAVLRAGRFQSLLNADQVYLRGVSGLLESSDGDLWINGLHGIVRIHAAEVVKAISSPGYHMRSEVFSEAGIVGPSSQGEGLPSAVVDAHGTFWFATSNTIVSVDPTSIHEDTTLPTLGFISATVDGVALSSTHKISPGYHTLRIAYFGSYIHAPEKVVYKYRLVGADKDWQSVGTRSEAVYTGLRPGKYKFAVMASAGEGAWTTPDTSLELTVEPSFYQTTTFLILSAACVITLLACAVRLRIVSVEARIREGAEARAGERLRIARDLHDTLLQGVQGLMLRFNAATRDLPPGKARMSLEDALLTADRVFIEGRNRVTRLRVENSEGLDLPEAFEALANDLDEGSGTSFTMKVVGTPRKQPPQVLQELLYIGREAITNSFRHANASEIRVTLAYGVKALELTVADNGCGFNVTKQTNNPLAGHWGLRGMQERAFALGANCKYDSDVQGGTRVHITLGARTAYTRQPSSFGGEVRLRAFLRQVLRTRHR